MNLTDTELLERFLTKKDHASFEEMVRRYASLVMGVCKRTLRNQQDAEDAFQATFLALVQRGDTIRKTQSVGCWLYGVAVRSAWTLIEKREVRHRKESQWGTEKMTNSTKTNSKWEE